VGSEWRINVRYLSVSRSDDRPTVAAVLSLVALPLQHASATAPISAWKVAATSTHQIVGTPPRSPRVASSSSDTVMSSPPRPTRDVGNTPRTRGIMAINRLWRGALRCPVVGHHGMNEMTRPTG